MEEESGGVEEESGVLRSGVVGIDVEEESGGVEAAPPFVFCVKNNLFNVFVPPLVLSANLSSKDNL